ncbi:LPS export ABC transporter periplasmic protein LptC [Prevotella sp. PCHR]|uniref:LPS export ABC transporter periplasmic protein LptC n=1 Tax=Xylanibacter caecicola TaxID=2736294 RepID=A0ABX2B4W3_9BACT|nr:LPS export ABC transporter periplasmic protein LptC [Xylanibacter caecicola]
MLRKSLKYLLYILLLCLCSFACTEEKEHIAPAIYPRDSVAMMTSYGVNTLISDSGVIKYRIVTERWEVNQARNPSRWIFDKGLFMEQFDEKFHVEAYIQCDTAYYFDQKKLWELRGRVRVRTTDGLRFSSEELYWDQSSHELYSNKFSRLVTPEREMQGSYFVSDERMTRYSISNSKGSFVKGGMGNSEKDSILTAPDTTKAKKRLPVSPSARTSPL